MADKAHRLTDEKLEEMEKRLERVYARAYGDVRKKADDYFARFAVKDRAKRELVNSGKLSKAEYSTWRRNQMLSGKRWTDLRDQLAMDLTNVNKIAAGMIRGELNEVFAINANYSEYLIENGMRTNYGFTLYDRETVANLVRNDPDLIPWQPKVDIPADLRWNRQMITSHITQGVLQGESIPHLSKRLLKTVNNDKVAAVRTARTAITSAQNAGRQVVYNNVKVMGLKLQKEWLATLDGRTRHDHGMADGQRVGLDEKFDVGGYKMKYPGDMSAPGWLVYNCRCTTITVEPPHITKGEEPRKTYSEWTLEKNGKNDHKVTASNFKATPTDTPGYGKSTVDGSMKAVRLYHGSNANFDKFDFTAGKAFKPGGADAYGEGFYFTSDPEQARLYGDNIYMVEVLYSTDRRTAKKTGREKDFDYNERTGYWVIPKTKSSNIKILAKKVVE